MSGSVLGYSTAAGLSEEGERKGETPMGVGGNSYAVSCLYIRWD